MRKTCAKVVDAARKIADAEHYLYSTFRKQQKPYVAKPQNFPISKHTFSNSASTTISSQIHLLSSKLSTVYTGLITNITKYTFSFNF